jgi:hypothetical protein
MLDSLITVLLQIITVENSDFTHPIKEDVKKKFFSVPLEGTRGW